MEETIKQINELYDGADSINFVTTFAADELPGCKTVDEALPRVTELYATPHTGRNSQVFNYEIKYVGPASPEDVWKEIDGAFADKGDHDQSQGVRFSLDEESKLNELHKAYKEQVKNYIKPDTAIYTFSSTKWTFDLFGFMLLNQDGNSLAIIAHNSD